MEHGDDPARAAALAEWDGLEAAWVRRQQGEADRLQPAEDSQRAEWARKYGADGPMLSNGVHLPYLSDPQLLSLRQRTDATRHFREFLQEWVRDQAVPLLLDTSRASEVLGWLERFEQHLIVVCEWWYPTRCDERFTAPETINLRFAAQQAWTVVRSFMGSGWHRDQPGGVMKLVQVRHFLSALRADVRALLPNLPAEPDGNPAATEIRAAPSVSSVTDPPSAATGWGIGKVVKKKPKPSATEAQERITGWLMGGCTPEERNHRLRATQAEVARATGLAESTVSKYLARSQHGMLNQLRTSRKTLGGEARPAAEDRDESDGPAEIAIQREAQRSRRPSKGRG